MTSIILGAQSNIWTQLTLPNPPSGAVPFVWTDNTSIAADPVNFKYNSIDQTLSVSNGLRMSVFTFPLGPAPVITMPSGAGRFKIPVGTNIVTINCPLAQLGDLIFTQIETVNSGYQSIVASVSAPGVITITSNGNAVEQTFVTFLLVKQA